MARLRSLALAALLLACGGLSEQVGTDVCLSGRRWTGHEVGDAEMAPGSDCVGCHLAKDGPQFVAGGTVYAALDNQDQIDRQCYGLEGVKVELEGADGQLWKMTTNRAGNFFFDGAPSLLVKPYVARFSYTKPDGTLVAPQMILPEPSYGGCAQCHNGRAVATPDLTAGNPDYVEPASGLFVQ
jgi:hypothetical protein